MRLCILSMILAGLLCFVGWVIHQTPVDAEPCTQPPKQPALYMLTETEERANGVTITRSYSGPLPPNEVLGWKNEGLPTPHPSQKGKTHP